MANNQNPTILFRDVSERVLAKGVLPHNALIEGTHGSTKEIEIVAPVCASGKLDHYIATASETIRGKVVQKPAGGLGRFSLDRLDVKAGELIRGQMQALTLKESAT